MFQSGTYVVYGCKGVHKILGTTHLNLEGVPKDREYYVMQAVKKPDGAVYAPVEAGKTNMRSVMTKEQAESFLHAAEGIHALSCKTPKQREENCREGIKSCSPDALLQVIKTVMERREEAYPFGFTLYRAGRGYSLRRVGHFAQYFTSRGGRED